RPGSAHRQVIHRAIDCQSPNISAGKENWRDHERIRGERQPGAIHLDHGLVVKLVENWVGEGRTEDFVNQLSRQLASAAVAQHDLLVLEDRQWAGTEYSHAGPPMEISVSLTSSLSLFRCLP